MPALVRGEDGFDSAEVDVVPRVRRELTLGLAVVDDDVPRDGRDGVDRGLDRVEQVAWPPGSENGDCLERSRADEAVVTVPTVLGVPQIEPLKGHPWGRYREVGHESSLGISDSDL